VWKVGLVGKARERHSRRRRGRPGPYPATNAYAYQFTVAVPNGDLLSTYDIDLKTSPLPKPWTGDLPGSTSNAYGDLQEAELALPSGASDEILFDIYRICAEPGGPTPGLLIDDLRVE